MPTLVINNQKGNGLNGKIEKVGLRMPIQALKVPAFGSSVRPALRITMLVRGIDMLENVKQAD